MDLQELPNTAREDLRETTTPKNPEFRLEKAKFGKGGNVSQFNVIVSYLEENADPNSAITDIYPEFVNKGTHKRLQLSENKKILGLYIFEPSKSR